MARKPDPELIDEDAPALTDDELAEMRPAAEVLPPDFYAMVTKRPRGRPKALQTKVPVTLRSTATSSKPSRLRARDGRRA